MFDLSVIGEGEEVLVELLNAYREWNKQGRSGGRRGFLERAVKIKGIYVPSFYKTEYNEDNTVKQWCLLMKVRLPLLKNAL